MTGIMQLDAFLFGIISAISLPLGVLIAFFWTPKPKLMGWLQEQCLQ